MVKDGTNATNHAPIVRKAATAAQLLAGIKFKPDPEPVRTSPLNDEEYQEREAAALKLKGYRSGVIRTKAGFVMGLGATYQPEGQAGSHVGTKRVRAE